MPDPTPRYLVPFHPKRVPHHFADLLIIGGGLAGLRAALAADPQLSVLVITKDSIRQSNSNYARGASRAYSIRKIASRITWPTRCRRRGFVRCRVVDMVVREAPARIRELIAWGARFDEESGSLALGAKGGTATTGSCTPWGMPRGAK